MNPQTPPGRRDLLTRWARRLPEGIPMEMYDTEMPWVVYVYGRTQDRWWPFWTSTRVLGRMAIGCRCAVCGEYRVVVSAIPHTGPIPDRGEHPERTRFKLDHLHRDRPHPMAWRQPLLNPAAHPGGIDLDLLAMRLEADLNE